MESSRPLAWKFCCDGQKLPPGTLGSGASLSDQWRQRRRRAIGRPRIRRRPTCRRRVGDVDRDSPDHSGRSLEAPHNSGRRPDALFLSPCGQRPPRRRRQSPAGTRPCLRERHLVVLCIFGMGGVDCSAGLAPCTDLYRSTKSPYSVSSAGFHFRYTRVCGVLCGSLTRPAVYVENSTE